MQIVRVYEQGREWLNAEGKPHREDGPAVEWANGSRVWYRDGELHREDGPAVERASGYKSWWIDGSRITKEEFDRRKKSEMNHGCKAATSSAVNRMFAASAMFG